MRIKEIKKGTAEIKRGHVLMSVEGPIEGVEAVQAIMKSAGWEDSSCIDEIEDGVYSLTYVVDRNEVADLKAEFKRAKAKI